MELSHILILALLGGFAFAGFFGRKDKEDAGELVYRDSPEKAALKWEALRARYSK